MSPIIAKIFFFVKFLNTIFSIPYQNRFHSLFFVIFRLCISCIPGGAFCLFCGRQMDTCASILSIFLVSMTKKTVVHTGSLRTGQLSLRNFYVIITISSLILLSEPRIPAFLTVQTYSSYSSQHPAD